MKINSQGWSLIFSNAAINGLFNTAYLVVTADDAVSKSMQGIADDRKENFRIMRSPVESCRPDSCSNRSKKYQKVSLKNP